MPVPSDPKGFPRRRLLAGAAGIAGAVALASIDTQSAVAAVPYQPVQYELSGFWHLVMWYTWFNGGPVTAAHNPGGVPLPVDLVGSQWVGPAGVAWGNDAYLGFGRYGWATDLGRAQDGVWDTNSINSSEPGTPNGIWYQLANPGTVPAPGMPAQQWAGQFVATVWVPATGLVIDMTSGGNTEAQGGGMLVFGGMSTNGGTPDERFAGQFTGQQNGDYQEGRFWMQRMATVPYLGAN